MRTLIALSLLVVGFGCQNPCKMSSVCCDTGPAVPCGDTQKPAPPCSTPPKCPAPQVEVKPAEVIHVNAPPEKVVVNLPPGGAQPCVQQPAPAFVAAGAPQASVAMVQSGSPQPGVAMVPAAVSQAPVMMQAVAAPVSTVASSTQTTSRSRDRFALGFDWVPIHLPLPRLYAIPGNQRVVTETQYNTVQPQMQLAVNPGVAMQPVQQVQYAAVASAPAAVQTAVMAAPPQVAAVPQSPQAVMVVPSVAQAAVAVNPCPPTTPPTKASVDELNKQLQQVQQLIDEQQQSRVRGVPLPPLETK